MLGDTRPLWEAWLEDVSRRAHVDPGAARRGAAELARAARALRRGSRARLPAAERAGDGGAAAASGRGRAGRRLHRRARGAGARSRSPISAPRGGSRRSRPGPARSSGCSRSSGRRRASFALWQTWRPDRSGPRAHRPSARGLLERLDRIAAELARLNRRQESRDELAVIAHELRNLNESLQAIAYAALGQRGRRCAAAAPAEAAPLARAVDVEHAARGVLVRVALGGGDAAVDDDRALPVGVADRQVGRRTPAGRRARRRGCRRSTGRRGARRRARGSSRRRRSTTPSCSLPPDERPGRRAARRWRGTPTCPSRSPAPRRGRSAQGRERSGARRPCRAARRRRAARAESRRSMPSLPPCTK